MNLKQLLIECKRNSVTAQRYLYEQYAKRMFLLCRRYVKNDEVAEEMVMNGFLKFFRSLDSFEYTSNEATEGYLVRIMVNECLKHLGKLSFLVLASDNIPDTPGNEDLVSRLSAKEIYIVITQLPLGYRVVFNMFVLEGMSHEEIANTLNITVGTSKSQLSKARQLLQQLLIKKDSTYANRKRK